MRALDFNQHGTICPRPSSDGNNAPVRRNVPGLNAAFCDFIAAFLLAVGIEMLRVDLASNAHNLAVAARSF